jgi:hypothetical protein
VTCVPEAGQLMPTSAPDVLLAQENVNSTHSLMSGSWQFVKQLALFSDRSL